MENTIFLKQMFFSQPMGVTMIGLGIEGLILFGFRRLFQRRDVFLENRSLTMFPLFVSRARTDTIQNIPIADSCVRDLKKDTDPISESTKESERRISTISMPQSVSLLGTVVSLAPQTIGLTEFRKCLEEAGFLSFRKLRDWKYLDWSHIIPEMSTISSNKSIIGLTTTIKRKGKRSSKSRKRSSGKTIRTRTA